MMINDINIPGQLLHLFVVLLFSVSLGIEQNKRHGESSDHNLLGTDRTFTFIGVLGFMLLQADATGLLPFLVGFCVLGILIAVFYYQKIALSSRLGLTSAVLALITYCFPLFVHISPLWLSLLVFVITLLFSGLKAPLRDFTDKLAKEESITLAKFVIIAGVVLPLLDDSLIAPWLPVSPYKIWLAVVVVSAISYLSYLLRRYVFPEAGLVLTGILGGLYSSTASTLILSKKSKTDTARPYTYATALLTATSMMFLRIEILAYIFHPQLGTLLLPYMGVLTAVSLGTALVLYRKCEKKTTAVSAATQGAEATENPLEFNVALLFATLYVVFTILTHFVVTNYGKEGLSGLSFVTGFTDIDPFLLNLFQGKYEVSTQTLAIATLQAIVSNNILKAVYCKLFAHRDTSRKALAGFAAIIGTNLAIVLLMWLS